MDEPISKSKLLDELQSARRQWDALMDEVGGGRMTQAGVVGDWSVKDVVAHLTSYDRWFVNAYEAHLRGESIPRDGSEDLSMDERNQLRYQQAQSHSLHEVLTESHRVFQRVLDIVESQSEEFLTQPQHFQGVPEAVLVCEFLRYDIYEHYREHIPEIRAWLDKCED